MGRIVGGLALVATGIAIWIVAIMVELSWLAVCFGSVVIGLILLIVAPGILIFPMAIIGTPGTSFLASGIQMLKDKP